MYKQFPSSWTYRDGKWHVVTPPSNLLEALDQFRDALFLTRLTLLRFGIFSLDGCPVGWVTSTTELAYPDHLSKLVDELEDFARQVRNETQDRPCSDSTCHVSTPRCGWMIRADVDQMIAAEAPRAVIEDDDDVDDWPAPPDKAAYYGLAGEIVRAIEPYSEADPVAILVQILVAFGNVVGRIPHFLAEADRHFTNMFALMVGDTSKGRKGTSWGWIRRIFASVDADWVNDHLSGGLSTGEGLIWAVRDEILKQEAIRDREGRISGYEDVVTDPGVDDKRLLAIEPEFARQLQAMRRESNTLSAVIRQAWDTGNLRITTRTSPARATDAHISLIGHITGGELRAELPKTSIVNGLVNRLFIVCVRRSKFLPLGGKLDTNSLTELEVKMKEAVDFARKVTEPIEFDTEATELWCEVYPTLSEGRPGMLGAATSRAEAQTRRLAMLYALLDSSPMIRVEHLRAALALWDYAERSAKHVFGDELGDAVADRILEALREKPKGLSRTQVVQLFKNHKSSSQINRAIRLLKTSKRIREVQECTRGRSAKRYLLADQRAKEAKKAKENPVQGTSFASFAGTTPPVEAEDEWGDV